MAFKNGVRIRKAKYRMSRRSAKKNAVPSH
jgi:hypothetical protein